MTVTTVTVRPRSIFDLHYMHILTENRLNLYKLNVLRFLDFLVNLLHGLLVVSTEYCLQQAENPHKSLLNAINKKTPRRNTVLMFQS